MRVADVVFSSHIMVRSCCVGDGDRSKEKDEGGLVTIGRERFRYGPEEQGELIWEKQESDDWTSGPNTITAVNIQ